MNDRLKRFLLRYGYRIERVYRGIPETAEWKTEYKTKGCIIEFIGVSGVGKTTFFNSAFPVFKSEWFPKSTIVYTFKVDEAKPFSKLDPTGELIYRELLNAKYHNIRKRGYTLQQEIAYYDYFKRELQYDAATRVFELPRGVITDDGIIHNFSDEILDLHANGITGRNADHVDLHHLFKNRALVYLKATPDYIVNNLKKRSVENKDALNDWNSIYGPSGLKSYVIQNVAIREKLISIAAGFGVPTLVIDCEQEKLQDSLNRLMLFVKEIISAR
jgi:hypothetical protein